MFDIHYHLLFALDDGRETIEVACKEELEAAEGKVQMLIKQRDGSVETEPFAT